MSGGFAWNRAKRERYANDLAFGRTLMAVTDNVNSSKGDRDPAEWLPPKTSAHCSYAIWWVMVKYRWRLAIDPRESGALRSLVSGNCGAIRVDTPPKGL